jgi:hypothetical protein
MALSWGLTSVRGNRGENCENEPWFAKKKKRKKKVSNTIWVFSSGFPKTLLIRGSPTV